ncbi:MAG: S1 family peptidase, partial [Haloechinothrix sp.]
MFSAPKGKHRAVPALLETPPSWTVKGVVTAALLIAASALGVASASAASQDVRPGAQPFIVGGRDAKVSEHPYVVYLADRRGEQYCGGTLVAQDRVVTAAHCVATKSDSSIRVVAGRQNVRDDDGTATTVRDVWVPDDYERVTDGQDIAVLTLADDLPYRTIRLADQHDEELYSPGRKATVYGWGRTEENGSSSNELQSAQIPIRPDEDCAEVYEDYLPESMVCAGYP